MASGGHDDQRHERRTEPSGVGKGVREGAYRAGGGGGSGVLTVGPGIRLKGELTACRTLVVEGQVEASVEAESIHIAAGGHFEGDVRVARAEIAGRFDGSLHVSGLLQVRKGARLDGTIRYQEVEVERGARLYGDWAEAEGADAAPIRAPGTRPVAPAPAQSAERPALDFLREDLRQS